MNTILHQLSHLIFLFVAFGLAPFLAVGQTTVSGMVTQSNGSPIEGANVYLEGSYDGASSNALGVFTFETNLTGTQTLTVSSVSFETFVMAANPKQMENVKVILREDVNSLDTVVLSAGTFEASDNSKVSVLKPLDVVTTASALGDFIGALQTLPGTATVAEDGRLFVRGGDASETQIFGYLRLIRHQQTTYRREDVTVLFYLMELPSQLEDTRQNLAKHFRRFCCLIPSMSRFRKRQIFQL